MITIGVIFLLILAGLALIQRRRRAKWKKAQKMFGYFEYDYFGEKGSSRDYGPMQEIDLIGARSYRQELGAVITFEVFHHDEDHIMEVIDNRYFLEQQQAKRRGTK